MNSTTSLKVTLADDDSDDCLFFKDAVDVLPLAISLTIVNDGEQLMRHLHTADANLPHALFLDLNMPRKNGFECLAEIKSNPKFKTLPVIIYSTSYDEEKANQLYDKGANYYICKPTDYEELKKVIHRALLLVQENDSKQIREQFFINKPKRLF